MTGPGVRVKQVADYDPVSGQTITTNYQYNLFSDSALTSGMLLTRTNVPTDMSYYACDYIRMGANSNYPRAGHHRTSFHFRFGHLYTTGAYCLFKKVVIILDFGSCRGYQLAHLGV